MGVVGIEAAAGRATMLNDIEANFEVSTGADNIGAAAGRATFMNVEESTEVSLGPD